MPLFAVILLVLVEPNLGDVSVDCDGLVDCVPLPVRREEPCSGLRVGELTSDGAEQMSVSDSYDDADGLHSESLDEWLLDLLRCGWLDIPGRPALLLLEKDKDDACIAVLRGACCDKGMAVVATK